MSTPLGCTTSQLMRAKRPLSQKKLCSSSLLPILAMPAMRKNVSPSTLFYFPSQVRIHPQIRSQITRLQSKYSLDLDPHSGVTQPKLSRATQTFTSVKAKQYTPVCSKHPRACKPQHRHPPLSLWRFHYLLSPTAAMSLNLASPNTPPLAPNPPRQGAAGDSTPQGPTMCSKFCPLAARRGCRSFHIDFLPAASQPPSKPPQPNRSLNGGP